VRAPGAGGAKGGQGLGGAARPRVVLSGGGTGGHIYPALAIAGELRRLLPDLEILYLGSREGMEAEIVPRAGLDFRGIPAAGFVGKGFRERVEGVLSLGRGFGEARRILSAFRPRAVVGTGGYASLPAGLAAVSLRLPLFLQEQNAYPGLSNRLLSPFCREVFLAWEEARPFFPRRARCRVVGNPVRREVVEADREEARSSLGLGKGEFLCLIFMGSRGSLTVNRVLVEALPELLRRHPGIRVVWVSGKDHYEGVRRVLEERGGGDEKDQNWLAGGMTGGWRLQLYPYLHDLPRYLAAADLVVCRAGALALAEITARGIPSLLVPSPHVAHGHQEANARALARRGAAAVIREAELTPFRLVREVEGLLGDSERLRLMARAARELGRPGAASSIAEVIFSHIHGSTVGRVPS